MLTNFLKYGAVASKVRVLYGKRLKNEDLRALAASNTVLDVATYLKDNTDYNRVFKGYNIQTLHRKDLENILINEFEQEYLRFIKFLDNRDEDLVRIYQSTIEVSEIIKFMVLFNQGLEKKYICSLPKSFIDISSIKYDELKNSESYEGFLKYVSKSVFYPVLLHFKPNNDDKVDIPLLETLLNAYHFNKVIERLSKEEDKKLRDKFLKLIYTEIDLINITRITRLRIYYKMPKEHAIIYLIPIYNKLSKEKISSMLDAKTADDIKNSLLNTPYYDVFEKLNKSFVDKSMSEYIYKVNRRLLRLSPPSVFTIIAYLNLKNIEIRNLANIIEGVRYDIPTSEITDYLVGYSKG